MLKVNRLTLTLIVFLSLAASGCESEDSAPAIRVLTTPTATPTSAPEQMVTPSQAPELVLQPTATPIPEPTDIPIADQLACGEIFCQVDWPGHLLRPFSPEFRNTIELTYPYASSMGGKLDVHHGVEFPNKFGTPVRAVADGVVLYAGNDNLTLLGPYTGFYGNVVILHHPELYEGQDLFSLYAHLSEFAVV